MDCDVAIKHFVDAAYVIERPATPDLVADHACALLAANGLRIEFGQSARLRVEHDRMVQANLPPGVGYISRSESSASRSPILFSGVPRMTKYLSSSQPSLSACLDTWTILGHAVTGRDISKAREFSSRVAMANGVSADTLRASACEDATASIIWNRSMDVLRHLAGQIDANSSTSCAIDTSFPVDDLRKFAMGGISGIHGSAMLGETYSGPSAPSEAQGFVAHSFEARASGPSWLPLEKFNADSLKIVQGVHPDLLSVVSLASKISTVAFQVVPITGGMRTSGLQNQLKANGHSKAVTGRHTLGLAIDLVPIDEDSQPDFKDSDGFNEIARAMEEAARRLQIPIQWGGNWKRFVDMPHFELNRHAYPAPSETAHPEEIVAAFK